MWLAGDADKQACLPHTPGLALSNGDRTCPELIRTFGGTASDP